MSVNDLSACVKKGKLSLIFLTIFFIDDQKSSPMNLPSALSNQNGVKRKVRTKKKKGVITANVAGTKYEIGKNSKPAPLKPGAFLPADHTHFNLYYSIKKVEWSLMN